MSCQPLKGYSSLGSYGKTGESTCGKWLAMATGCFNGAAEAIANTARYVGSNPWAEADVHRS